MVVGTAAAFAEHDEVPRVPVERLRALGRYEVVDVRVVVVERLQVEELVPGLSGS